MKRIILIMLIMSIYVIVGNAQSDSFKFISSGDTFKLGSQSDVSGSITISPALPNASTSLSIGISYDIESGQEYTVSGQFKELEVKENELTSLDLRSLSKVKKVNCSSNKLTTLQIAGMSKLKDINFGNNLLSFVDFSNLNDLKVIWGHANKFIELDFTSLNKLKYMTCASNQLTSLNVAGLKKLKALWCYDNNLKTVDVSGSKKLRDFRCYNNPFTVCGLDSLFTNLPNKNRDDDDNNPRIFIANKNAGIAPNNECRTHLANEKGWRVMDLNDATGYNPSGDIEINNSAPFGCEDFEEPTPVLEEESFKFISSGTTFKLGNNSDVSGPITISPALPNEATSIQVGISYDIQSGQEYTVAGKFKELEVKENELTSLDLRFLSKVKKVNCSSNKLTTLQISGMPNLKDINFGNNLLTSVDFSNLEDLKVIWGHANKFTTLDFTNLKSLKYMTCASNQLTSLNVAGLKKLKALWCYDNNLKTVDVSESKKLRDFRCYNNPFTACGLDSLFTNLPNKNRDDDDDDPRIFIANKNAGIAPNNECRTHLANEKGWRVMDLNDATGYNPSGDIEINNSAPFGCEPTFISNELFPQNNIDIFPNPINDVLQIRSYENIIKISILDISGKLILEENINNTYSRIEMSKFGRGIYVLRVQTINKVDNFKIVKN